MKKLFILIITVLYTSVSFSQIAVVASYSVAVGGVGGTTPSGTTTGANLLIAILGYTKTTPPNISDSKSNTWVLANKYEDPLSNAGVAVFYSWGTISVGSSHTFSTTSALAGLFVLAVSGARSATNPLDQNNGTTTSLAGSSIQPGSITPSVSGTIVVTAVDQNASGGAPTDPSTYTLIGSFAVGTSFPAGGAYKILTGSGSENPSWGVTPSVNAAVMVANFMPPAAFVPNNSNFLMFMRK